MRRIYISGPIRVGDRNWNLYQSLMAHERLLREGFAVYNPMPSMQLPFNDAKFGGEILLLQDFCWIDVCDALLRLPGESIGGDLEVKHAEKVRVPVYYDLEALINEMRTC